MSNPSAIAIILLLDPILLDSTFSSCWMPLVLLFIPNNGVFPYKTMINPSLFSSCASFILPFSATKASTDSRFCLFNNGISCFIFYFLLLSQLPPIASGLRDSPKGSSPGTNVSRTAPSFIILVCVFFVLALVIVYTRQCVENHHRLEGFPVGRETSSGRSRMNIRGLDEEAIASFPTFFYSTVKELKIGKGSLECAICLNKFADAENLRLLHKCSHVFHSDCIDAWLTSHSTCPLCRANLVPQPDDWDSSFFPPVHSDYDSGMGEADDRSSPNESINRTEIHIAENSIPNQTNQNSSSILRSPFRSCTPGWRLNRIFHRSHSTGHSLLPPRGNYERFTLTLPEDVRCELLKTTASLNQGRRCVSFRRIQSSRQGYRTESELEKNLIFPSNRMEWIDWSEWRRLEHKGSGSELLSMRVNEDAA